MADRREVKLPEIAAFSGVRARLNESVPTNSGQTDYKILDQVDEASTSKLAEGYTISKGNRWYTISDDLKGEVYAINYGKRDMISDYNMGKLPKGRYASYGDIERDSGVFTILRPCYDDDTWGKKHWFLVSKAVFKKMSDRGPTHLTPPKDWEDLKSIEAQASEKGGKQSDESLIARKMQEKGYTHILVVEGSEPIYAKSVKTLKDIQATRYADADSRISNISEFIGEESADEPANDEPAILATTMVKLQKKFPMWKIIDHIASAVSVSSNVNDAAKQKLAPLFDKISRIVKPLRIIKVSEVDVSKSQKPGGTSPDTGDTWENYYKKMAPRVKKNYTGKYKPSKTTSVPDGMDDFNKDVFGSWGEIEGSVIRQKPLEGCHEKVDAAFEQAAKKHNVSKDDKFYQEQLSDYHYMVDIIYAVNKLFFGHELPDYIKAIKEGADVVRILISSEHFQALKDHMVGKGYDECTLIGGNELTESDAAFIAEVPEVEMAEIVEIFGWGAKKKDSGEKLKKQRAAVYRFAHSKDDEGGMKHSAPRAFKGKKNKAYGSAEFRQKYRHVNQSAGAPEGEPVNEQEDEEEPCACDSCGYEGEAVPGTTCPECGEGIMAAVESGSDDDTEEFVTTEGVTEQDDDDDDDEDGGDEEDSDEDDDEDSDEEDVEEAKRKRSRKRDKSCGSSNAEDNTEESKIDVTVPRTKIDSFSDYAKKCGVSLDSPITFTESGDMKITISVAEAGIMGISVVDGDLKPDQNGLVEMKFPKSDVDRVIALAESLNLPADTPIHYEDGNFCISVPADLSEKFV